MYMHMHMWLQGGHIGLHAGCIGLPAVLISWVSSLLTAYSPSGGHAWELLEHPVRVVHRRTVLLEQLLRRIVMWLGTRLHGYSLYYHTNGCL